MRNRCHKCNVPVTEEIYTLLEIRCMGGFCSIKEISKEKGCDFCGAHYDIIIKQMVMDKLK